MALGHKSRTLRNTIIYKSWSEPNKKKFRKKEFGVLKNIGREFFTLVLQLQNKSLWKY